MWDSACNMTKPRLLEIPEGEDVFKYLAKVLPEYCEKELGSESFIVEGNVENPRIGLRYPGKKLHKRKLKRVNKNSVLWANLLDFEVIPFNKGKEVSSNVFNYRNLLLDFEKYKKENDEFWSIVEKLYKTNIILKNPPKLDGIESKQFLEMLKWMWIQEDLNYRLSWAETGSKIKYNLENKTGSSTRKGAGRGKFFAKLLLVKYHGFSADVVNRIIP